MTSLLPSKVTSISVLAKPATAISMTYLLSLICLILYGGYDGMFLATVLETSCIWFRMSSKPTVKGSKDLWIDSHCGNRDSVLVIDFSLLSEFKKLPSQRAQHIIILVFILVVKHFVVFYQYYTWL